MSTYSKETPDEILHNWTMEWLADEHFFYGELKQLGLAAQRKVRNSLGEQIRKDMICNLKSLLNVLSEDIGKSEKKLSPFLTEKSITGNSAPRELYLAIITAMYPIRKKIRLLKWHKLAFLRQIQFYESRNYKY